MKHEILNELKTKRQLSAECCEAIETAFEMLMSCYRANKKLVVCGNGGSFADAQHIVGELMKGFCSKRSLPADVKSSLINHGGEIGRKIADQLQTPLRAISLGSELALASAIQNDMDGELIFAQQALGLLDKDDILLGISTSGNAKNVQAAFIVAKALGAKTILLTGGTGGILKDHADCAIIAPGQNTAEIQENHLPIYHALCRMLEQSLFS
jgi:D-sedoheptulose 7-phosphate isomerase